MADFGQHYNWLCEFRSILRCLSGIGGDIQGGVHESDHYFVFMFQFIGKYGNGGTKIFTSWLIWALDWTLPVSISVFTLDTMHPEH